MVLGYRYSLDGTVPLRYRHGMRYLTLAGLLLVAACSPQGTDDSTTRGGALGANTADAAVALPDASQGSFDAAPVPEVTPEAEIAPDAAPGPLGNECFWHTDCAEGQYCDDSGARTICVDWPSQCSHACIEGAGCGGGQGGGQLPVCLLEYGCCSYQ